MVREISKDAALRGKVIPLAFHVDYWNHLGWRDPFSDAEWTRRQSDYARALAVETTYTPQMVVDGARQFVASARALDAAIAEESRQPAFGTVRVELVRSGAMLDATLDANVTSGRSTDVVLVVYENRLSTKIAAGENEGTASVDDAVVRRLIRVETLRRGTIEKMISIPIDRAWNAANLGVAVFLQDRGTLAIRGAATARVAS